MSLKVLALDFDGVVVESNDVKDRVFDEIFARFPEQSEQIARFHDANHSVPRRRKFEHLVYDLMQRPDDRALVESLVDDFSRSAFERVVACPEVPGAGRLLAEFALRLPIYIVSVNPQDQLEAIIRERGLSRWFAGVYGDPPVRKADAIREILKRHGAAPGELLFVGDSQADYAAAQETGVRFVGRMSGRRFQPSPQTVCEDLHGVVEILRRELS